MKISESSATGRVTPSAGAAPRPSPGVTAGAPAASDSAAVLGIPAAELTPRVQSAITTLMGELQGLRGQLERMQQRVADLERLADRDTLTPLVNRRAFLREVDRTAAHIARHGSAATVMMIDLDGLKAINDTYGHAAGDAAILHMGDVLNQNTRRTDLVGRLGGDEFVVLMVQSDTDQAVAKALDIRAALARQPLKLDQATVPMSFSFGVQPIQPGMTAEAVLERADQAMYREKQARRGKVAVAG